MSCLGLLHMSMSFGLLWQEKESQIKVSKTVELDQVATDVLDMFQFDIWIKLIFVYDSLFLFYKVVIDYFCTIYTSYSVEHSDFPNT